jgi:hypothetical protein
MRTVTLLDGILLTVDEHWTPPPRNAIYVAVITRSRYHAGVLGMNPGLESP